MLTTVFRQCCHKLVLSLYFYKSILSIRNIANEMYRLVQLDWLVCLEHLVILINIKLHLIIYNYLY